MLGDSKQGFASGAAQMAERHEQRFVPLDGLRGVSVVLVLLAHTIAVPLFGGVGVDLFFVLSGYLITGIIATGYDAGRFSFRRFYKRRFVRLFPALIATCVLFLGLVSAFPGFDGAPWKSVAASVLMVSNYTLAAGYGFPTAMGHTWTLASEWQFYIIWPAVYIGAKRRGVDDRRILLGLFAAIAAVWVIRYATTNTMWHWRALDARADGLLYGCVLALALRIVPSWRLPAFVPILAGAAFLWIAFFPIGQQLNASNFLSFWIVAGVVMGSSRLLNRALELDALSYLGRISYGLYLYHFPIAAACFVLGLSPTMNLVVTAATAVPLSVLSWHLLEKPLLARPRRRKPLLPT